MLSESARRVRSPSHLHLGDAEMGKNRPRNPLHHPSQTEITERADFESLILCLLRTDIQTFIKPKIPDLLWTQIYATAVASGCNPGCKRLRPESQPFISTENHLLPPQFSCPSEHMAESSGRSFWALKAVRRPPQEDSEGEKPPQMDAFPAQNGPNVQ